MATKPLCQYQTCIVHLLRNSMALPNKEQALRMLDALEQSWNHKYPAPTQS